MSSARPRDFSPFNHQDLESLMAVISPELGDSKPEHGLALLPGSLGKLAFLVFHFGPVAQWRPLFPFGWGGAPLKTQPTKKGCPFLSHGHWAFEFGLLTHRPSSPSSLQLPVTDVQRGNVESRALKRPGLPCCPFHLALVLVFVLQDILWSP